MYEIAATTGTASVAELRQKLSYGELAQWEAFFENRLKRRDKLEYYLAQLTMYCATFFGADVDAEELFIDWDGEAAKPVEMEPREMAMLLAGAFGAEIVDLRGERSDGKSINGNADRVSDR